MSKTVLPSLVEAKAQLTAQAEALQQALAETQAKRKGLLTVMEMFDTSSGSAQFTEDAVATIAKAIVGDRPDNVDTDTTAAKAQDSTTAPAKPAAKTKRVGRPPKAAKAAKTTKSVRGRGRAGDWQNYILDEYKSDPLPEVIENVLKANAKTIFKIANLMALIFQADMPESQYLKARNRVSNILSAGARNGDWYRGRGGTYSFDKKVVQY